MADAQSVQVDLNNAIIALAHKHASVSFTLIGVLVLVLGLAGVGGYIALKFADAQLARAQQLETKYDADRKVWQDQLAVSEAARAQATTQQQAIVKVVDTRDKTTDKAITDALKPDATLPAVELGLRSAYKADPLFQAPLPLNGVYVELGQAQAQALTATKLDRDRLFLDLADEKNVFNLEQQKNSSLSSDLDKCKVDNAEAGKVIAAYKKAAYRSKFQKFLSGAEKVGLFVGGMYLGHKL
jgi:hypothetical protein